MRAILLFFQTTALAQDDTIAPAVAEDGSFRILDLLLAPGTVWFTIPLLIMSIIAVYIFVTRWFRIRNASNIDPAFMSNIREEMLKGNIKGALDLCKNKDTTISRIVEKGILRIGKPLSSIQMAIENEGRLELQKLEKNLATLATISGAAPMLGFLGTVTGMITAFYQLSRAGSNVDPGMLAGGIYQALVTTATGLFVGIIAFICYNILVAMVERLVHKMETTTVQFIDFLQEPA